MWTIWLICLHVLMYACTVCLCHSMHSGGKGHKGRWAHRVISYESSSAATTTTATNGSTPGNNNNNNSNSNGSSSSGSTILTGPCIHWHSSKLFSTERAGFSIRDITKVDTTTCARYFQSTSCVKHCQKHVQLCYTLQWHSCVSLSANVCIYLQRSTNATSVF
jgi:hypothetical protein